MQLRARAARAAFCLLVTTIGVVAAGCSIRHNDRYCDADENAEDDDCEARPAKDGPPSAPTAATPSPSALETVCDSFCDRLVVCGSIRASAVVACRADCQAGLLADPVATRAGCACVERDACRPVSAYACPGAPLPPAQDGPGSPGQGGSAGGTGTSGGAAGGTGTVCTASCQCEEGEACVGGRCVVDAPPPAGCETDCECLKGQRCVVGSCE